MEHLTPEEKTST